LIFPSSKPKAIYHLNPIEIVRKDQVVVELDPDKEVLLLLLFEEQVGTDRVNNRPNNRIS